MFNKVIDYVVLFYKSILNIVSLINETANNEFSF